MAYSEEIKHIRPDYIFKILVVGNSSSGKTSILNRFIDDNFNQSHISTIAVDLKIKNLEFNNKNIKLQIWDLAGQERFKIITSSYYKEINAIIIVFDVTNKNSYDSIKNWIDSINMFAPKNINLILVGNKIDLNNIRVIDKIDAEYMALDLDSIYIETSAKDNINIDKLFNIICTLLLEKYKDNMLINYTNISNNYHNIDNNYQNNIIRLNKEVDNINNNKSIFGFINYMYCNII